MPGRSTTRAQVDGAEGTWRVGTETPFTTYRGTQAAVDRWSPE
jgi:hypothetical protein